MDHITAASQKKALEKAVARTKAGKDIELLSLAKDLAHALREGVSGSSGYSRSSARRHQSSVRSFWRHRCVLRGSDDHQGGCQTQLKDRKHPGAKLKMNGPAADVSKIRTNFGMEVSSRSTHFSCFVNAAVNALTMPSADETRPEAGLQTRPIRHTLRESQ